MQRIDGPFNISTKPDLSPPANDPGFFSGGDPLRGVKATRVTKDWLNRVQEEICHVIEAAEIPLDRADDTQLLQALRILFLINDGGGGSGGGGGGGSGGGGTAATGYLTEFRGFYEKTPPPGWARRYGELLVGADAAYPELWAALQKPANAWKCKTQAAWDTMRQATPFKGVGGVPYFVIDVAAKTVRLPDTRGMYLEDAGFDGLEVGGVHGDAIRNITGAVTANRFNRGGTATGAFAATYPGQPGVDGHEGNSMCFDFNASRMVPTASVNRPKAFGILPCVYVGGASL